MQSTTDKTFNDGPFFTHVAPGICRCHNTGFGTFVITEDGAREAIKNVTAERTIYATEEAWRRQLSLYERALAYMQVQP